MMKIRKLFFSFGFLATAWFCWPGVASATTVFSPILEIEALPGEVQRGALKVFNETEEDIFLTSSVEAFRAGDETGQPIYLPPEESGEFLNWFSLDHESIILQPKQVGIIPFTITVPPSAIPGGYYAVVFWQSAPEDVNGEGVNISSKVGTLIFLEVAGDIVESGNLLDFNVTPSSPLWGYPGKFNVRFENKGNIHLTPTGLIMIKNMFGLTQTLDINPGANRVLPKSIRKYEVVWGELGNQNGWQAFWESLKLEFTSLNIGKINASVVINFGEEDIQSSSQSISFWFIPWRSLSVLALGLIVVIFLIRLNSKINKIKKRAKKSNIFDAPKQ